METMPVLNGATNQCAYVCNYVNAVIHTVTQPFLCLKVIITNAEFTYATSLSTLDVVH